VSVPLTLLSFFFPDERADDSNLILAVLCKVETKLSGRTELHEVVIKRLLSNFNALSGFFESQLDEISIHMAASVIETPFADLFYHLLNSSLLNTRLSAGHFSLMSLFLTFFGLISLGVVNTD